MSKESAQQFKSLFGNQERRISVRVDLLKPTEKQQESEAYVEKLTPMEIQPENLILYTNGDGSETLSTQIQNGINDEPTKNQHKILPKTPDAVPRKIASDHLRQKENDDTEIGTPFSEFVPELRNNSKCTSTPIRSATHPNVPNEIQIEDQILKNVDKTTEMRMCGRQTDHNVISMDLTENEMTANIHADLQNNKEKQPEVLQQEELQLPDENVTSSNRHIFSHSKANPCESHASSPPNRARAQLSIPIANELRHSSLHLKRQRNGQRILSSPQKQTLIREKTLTAVSTRDLLPESSDHTAAKKASKTPKKSIKRRSRSRFKRKISKKANKGECRESSSSSSPLSRDQSPVQGQNSKRVSARVVSRSPTTFPAQISEQTEVIQPLAKTSNAQLYKRRLRLRSRSKIKPLEHSIGEEALSAANRCPIEQELTKEQSVIHSKSPHNVQTPKHHDEPISITLLKTKVLRQKKKLCQAPSKSTEVSNKSHHSPHSKHELKPFGKESDNLNLPRTSTPRKIANNENDKQTSIGPKKSLVHEKTSIQSRQPLSSLNPNTLLSQVFPREKTPIKKLSKVKQRVNPTQKKSKKTEKVKVTSTRAQTSPIADDLAQISSHESPPEIPTNNQDKQTTIVPEDALVHEKPSSSIQSRQPLSPLNPNTLLSQVFPRMKTPTKERSKAKQCVDSTPKTSKKAEKVQKTKKLTNPQTQISPKTSAGPNTKQLERTRKTRFQDAIDSATNYESTCALRRSKRERKPTKIEPYAIEIYTRAYFPEEFKKKINEKKQKEKENKPRNQNIPSNVEQQNLKTQVQTSTARELAITTLVNNENNPKSDEPKLPAVPEKTAGIVSWLQSSSSSSENSNGSRYDSNIHRFDGHFLSREHLQFQNHNDIEFRFYENQSENHTLGYIIFKPKAVKQMVQLKHSSMQFVCINGSFKFNIKDRNSGETKEYLCNSGDVFEVHVGEKYGIENLNETENGQLMMIKGNCLDT